MQPLALVITGYGINCEEETAKCFELTGGQAKIVHINDLIEDPKALEQAQILAFPGGFSYGDDTGAGNAIANKMKNHLKEDIINFATADKLIIGICNGFQMITNLGLLPAIDEKYDERQAALMPNRQARYECRWIYTKNTSQKCIWTRDIEVLHVPIAHGEGNFYANDTIIKALQANDQIAMTYCHKDGSPANGEFPLNPNGAMLDIAGVCDPSGRIFGYMPHPERFNAFTNEEDWQLEKEKLIRANEPLPTEGEGLKIFRNAIEYFT